MDQICLLRPINSVVGETIMDLVWPKPSSFELFDVNFSRFHKPHDMIINYKGFLFALLVRPFYQAGLSFHGCLSRNLRGFF